MSIKLKLTSMIIAFVLVASMLLVGVFAAVNVQLQIGGTVNFVVNETEVYLNKVTLKNIVAETGNGYQAEESVLDNYSDLYIQANTSLDLSNVTVLSGQTMEIDLDMTSLSENYLKVVLSYSNLPSTVSISSTSLFMPYNTSGDLAQGETKTYKIYIRNTGSSSLSLSDINLQVSFDNSFGTSLLKVDTVNQYWYVEMGTIATDMGSEYIRWRYISADGENPYTYSTSAPTGIGYFLLETDITRNYRENSVFVCPINAVPFNSDSNCISWDDDLKHNLNGWTNIPANDYSASIIRRYINGEDVNIDVEGEYDGIMLPSGDKSNMYTDLNIDIENDLVFQNIIGRTLGDLYSDMYASASGGAVEFPTFYEDADIIYTENDIDKFWL